MIARKIINKADRMMDDACRDDNYPRSIAKAIGAGIIEGVVDGAILVYLVNTAYDIYKLAAKK